MLLVTNLPWCEQWSASFDDIDALPSHATTPDKSHSPHRVRSSPVLVKVTYYHFHRHHQEEN
eukprot:3227564-Amphidinium_carterae.1